MTPKSVNAENEARTSALLLAFQKSLETLVALDAQNRNASVLKGFGQAEEDRPQHSLRFDAQRQQHLCKTDDVARNAAEQNDDPCAVGQRLQPGLDSTEEGFHYNIE